MSDSVPDHTSCEESVGCVSAIVGNYGANVDRTTPVDVGDGGGDDDSGWWW